MDKTKKENVVPINGVSPSPSERSMTRDDRRIIFQKIDDIYVNEKVGYSAGWSDARVAEDLGVPRTWVAKMREEHFGPDTNEDSVRLFSEAKEVLSELKATALAAEPVVRALNELVRKAADVEDALQKLTTVH